MQTNLFVMNIPSSWTNDKLRKVFGEYGTIRKSAVVGDGTGWVQFEDDHQACTAKGRLNKPIIEQGCNLDIVLIRTRKDLTNAYRLRQIPQSIAYDPDPNVYVANIPRYDMTIHFPNIYLSSNFSVYI